MTSANYVPGYIMPRNLKEHKYENHASNYKNHTYMSAEDQAAGKKSSWTELEITGPIRNLSPSLFQMHHLTVLHLKNNNLQRVSPDISQLVNLRTLDMSNNKLRSLPAELGDLMNLRYFFTISIVLKHFSDLHLAFNFSFQNKNRECQLVYNPI